MTLKVRISMPWISAVRRGRRVGLNIEADDHGRASRLRRPGRRQPALTSLSVIMAGGLVQQVDLDLFLLVAQFLERVDDRLQ